MDFIFRVNNLHTTVLNAEFRSTFANIFKVLSDLEMLHSHFLTQVQSSSH